MFKRIVGLVVVLLVLVAAVVVAQQAQGQRQGQAAPAPAQAAQGQRAPLAKAGTVTFNTVITKLKSGQHVFCETVSRPDTALCRRYCRENPKPDYIWLEMQHSRIDWETIDQMIQICAQEKVPPFVRVPQVYAPDDIQRAADAGALGIIVPMVEDVEVVMNAVRWFRNPIMDINNPSVKPWGFRSQGGNGLWGPDYNSNWNNNAFIMLQIESGVGTYNLERILEATEGGVQAVMVASSDFGAQEGDRDGSPTYNAREKVVHDVTLAHGITLVGPSSWYNNPSHPGYQMYQGMPRQQAQPVPAEH